MQAFYLNPSDRPYAFKLTVNMAGTPEKVRTAEDLIFYLGQSLGNKKFFRVNGTDPDLLNSPLPSLSFENAVLVKIEYQSSGKE